MHEAISGSEQWQLKTILEPEKRLQLCRFSTDGKWLAAGTGENAVMVWDAQTLQPRFVLPVASDGEHEIRAIGFSPDNQWLVVGTWDYDRAGKILALRFGAGESPGLLWEVEVSGQISDLDFQPGTQHLAMAFYEQNMALYRFSDGQRIREIRMEEEVNSISFHPTKDLVALGTYNTISILNTINYQPWQILTGGAFYVAFSPRGDRLAAATGGGPTGCRTEAGSCAVKIWNLPYVEED